MGKDFINQTKGFSDGIYVCRYSSETEYFGKEMFDVLSCLCEDYKPDRKESEFESPVLLAKYTTTIQAVQDFAKENNLEITTENLGSDPIDYYHDFNVQPPKYLERKIVRLFDKPLSPENILMARGIKLHTTSYNAGLEGKFSIGVPIDKKELFDYIVRCVQNPIPPPKDFRKMLLEIHTDRDLEMMQEIAGAFGLKATARDFF